MDVIAVNMAGFPNAVATLGTALTSEQARIMAKYTKKVILSYDSDDAGVAAAKRAIPILTDVGLEVKLLRMEGAKDPDEYIKKNGRDAFMKLLDNAMPYIDYKLQAAKRGLDLSSEEGKLDYMKKISPILSDLSPVEADIYIKKIAKDVGIAEGAIKLEILGNNNAEQDNNRFQPRHEAEDCSHSLPSMEVTVFKCI